MDSKALDKYLNDMASEVFTWGTHDCVTFALTGAGKVYNKDLMSGLPVWKDKDEAHKAIQSLGKDLHEAANTYLPTAGMQKVKIPQQGDVAVYNTNKGWTFFLVVSEKTMAAFDDNGLIFNHAMGEFWRCK